jgi:Bacterial self-protective colicin-like immunity
VVAEPWWSGWVPSTTPYAVLLQLFVDGRLTAQELEVLYLRLYLKDDTMWPEDVFLILDGFFADVDDYAPDQKVRAEVGGLDDEALRRRAERALDRLREIAGP